MKNKNLYNLIVNRAHEKGFIGEEEDVLKQVIKRYKVIPTELDKINFAVSMVGSYHLSDFLEAINEIDQTALYSKSEFDDTYNKGKQLDIDIRGEIEVTDEDKVIISQFFTLVEKLPTHLKVKIVIGNQDYEADKNECLKLDLKPFVIDAINKRFGDE